MVIIALLVSSGMNGSWCPIHLSPLLSSAPGASLELPKQGFETHGARRSQRWAVLETEPGKAGAGAQLAQDGTGWKGMGTTRTGAAPELGGGQHRITHFPGSQDKVEASFDGMDTGRRACGPGAQRGHPPSLVFRIHPR